MKDYVLLLHIKQKFDAFTKSEQKIAQYILDNPEAVVNSTIMELAELSHCSEATIVRFCRSMGYSGFLKFKISYAQNVVDPYKHLNPTFEKDDSTDKIIEKVFYNVKLALDQTKAILDNDTFQKAVAVIHDCKRLEIFGSGGSGIVAKDLQHKLLKLALNVILMKILIFSLCRHPFWEREMWQWGSLIRELTVELLNALN